MIGALLAGGIGSRMGGAKPAAELAGRPLIAYPASALGEVCERVAVICKPGSELPELPGTERWEEPELPRHPRTGIAFALEHAGEPLLVCAADMPFVTADSCRSLLAAAGSRAGASAAVAVSEGILQPVLGVYAPAALTGLRAAAPEEPLTRTVDSLDPVRVALPPAVVRSVDTPEELSRAEAELSAPG
jgi:molybdopterin-guanine dinucleotide biosynthesis protein A